MAFSLEKLAEIIAERARSGAGKSYTKELLDAGVEKCAKKLGEEAVETTLAAVGGKPEALVAESADLLYHLLVLLQARGVPLSDALAELGRRAARSGLEEKAARGKG
jgi:phosphoribosyl-ATP pyrophosphohydrolase